MDARLPEAIPPDANVFLLFSPFTGAAVETLAQNLESSPR